MNAVWGLVLVVFTLLLGWLAQVVNAFAPALAQRLSLNEREEEVDPVFFLDTRGEAIWDVLTVWILPAAGILLLLGNPAWAYFGLVGGGIYLYVAGRGIAVRLVMQGRGIRIGKPETVRLAYGFLVVYGLLGLVTILMAVAALPLPS